MVVVPAGQFMMGSPESEPGHSKGEEQVRVSIPSPFAVSRFAVTFDEWDACVAESGWFSGCYKPNDEGWGRDNRPAINISWDDAKTYVAWLSKKTGHKYRLLSEAEREYVARTGKTTQFWWGSSITPKQANYDGSTVKHAEQEYDACIERNTQKTVTANLEQCTPLEAKLKSAQARSLGYLQRTVPVDSFQPNPWGLYNVHGNVEEWTEDCWDDSNTGNPGDGRPRMTFDCTQRAVRGGSWHSLPQDVRSAYRSWRDAGRRNIDVGFRLARTLNP
jgi:formylglycine-generating enzyme required for sulfatase activity